MKTEIRIVINRRLAPGELQKIADFIGKDHIMSCNIFHYFFR